MSAQFSRRELLAAGAALPAAAAARPVRIAFLGCSHSHADAKVALVAKSPLFSLAGVWDRNPAVTAPLAARGVPLLTRERILADRDIEAVAVESMDQHHGEDGIAVLESGRHLHLEKPPATSLAGMRRIVHLAGEKKLVLQTGYMWRYNPGLNLALEAARNGWLGDIYMVRGTIDTLIDPARRPEWALFRGGHMFSLGCHLIDPLVRLLGKPSRVTPYLRRHGGMADSLNDNTVAVFEYLHALAVIQGATLQPRAGRQRTFEIFGRNGVARLNPIEPPRLEIDLAKAAGPYRAGPQPAPLPAYTRYVADFEAFHQAVRGSGTLPVSLQQELAIEEVLLEACEMQR